MYEISSKSEVDQYGNVLFLVTFKEDDIIVEKRMEPTKFAELLLGSIKQDVKMLSIPKLPDCVHKAKMGSDGNEGSFEAVMLFKAQKRGFSYADKIFYIPFPALVMKVSFVKGIRKDTRIYALDTDDPTSDSHLYNYPFGNVYGDGTICFGNIEVRAKNLEQAPNVFDCFINGKTNHDLYGANRRSNRDLSQGEYVQQLEKTDVFPTEDLVRVFSGNYKKYSDL